MARKAFRGLPTAVYLLFDQKQPGGPRYIGTSTRPQAQFRNHLKAARDGKPGLKNDWIRKLLKADRKPALHIVGTYPDERDALGTQEVLLVDARAKGICLNEVKPSRGGIEVDPGNEPHEAVVKAVGRNGAHVHVPRAWLGRKVRVTPID